MSGQFDNCTAVTPECPVEGTTYGYTPNFAANTVLLAVFGVTAIVQAGLGIRYRLPAYSSVVTINCVTEAIGYAGRLIMNDNPWDDVGFKIQIVCLILAPSFLAAGIYLTLKHLITHFGPEHSRLPPHLYTWIFISADALSIVLQSIGGGLAASGTGDIADTGSDIMTAGVAVQVATMSICVILAIDFGFTLWRARRNARDSTSLDEKIRPSTTNKGFKLYLFAFVVAFTAIYTRCVYRLPEMAGGWGNELMRNETEFLVLDGAMIAFASILMTLMHPGIFFPEMRKNNIAAPEPMNFGMASSCSSSGKEVPQDV